MKFINIFFLIFIFSCSKDRELPIYGRSEIVKNETNEGLIYDTIHHTIKEFEFINQDSLIVNNETFKNSIYVADFFFTTCPTICPVMKNNLIKVYNNYLDNDKVMYLSHTINPEYDNVKVLRNYSDRLNINSNIWHFVTGDINQIYMIAKNSYMVTAIEDENEPGGFLHSGAFLLVDSKKKIRGVYDGTIESEINRLISDIEILLKTTT